MSRSDRFRAVAVAALPLLVAEAAARLLAPREPAPAAGPVALSAHFSSAEISRGRAFARPQLALALTGTAIEAGVLVAAARRPPRWLTGLPPSAAGGAAAGAGLSALLSLAVLPTSALARRRSLKVGLSTQSWPQWSVDVGKAAAVGSALAGGAGAALLEIMRRWPQRWWLLGSAGSVGLGAGLAILAPVALDPIFNDFTPLPPGEARADVLALAEAAGVRVGEAYVVDASRRTTAANAYVTGLGPTKRVVLYDTLLDRYSRQEVRVVVAHELAHVHGRDVARGVLFAGLVALPGGLAVAQLVGGPAVPPRPAALPRLAVTAGAVLAPVGLVVNRLSRRLERRADWFSLRLTQDSGAFISFERKIALQNLADLDPPRWLTKVLATHPSTAERIGLAATYAAGHQPAPR